LIEQSQTERNEAVGSQHFETALEGYLNDVVEAEKEEYHSSIQPFAAFENEIRSKLGDSIRFFQENYSKGYQALIEEIKREIEMSKSKEDLLPFVIADQEKLKIFDDPERLFKAFEEGSSIYELLGFTEKSLNLFYHAANHLLEAKEHKKAQEAFYFLVTIAPEIYPFWIGLGHCYKNLGEQQTALQVLLQAIGIDPTQVAAYLDVAILFVEAHDAQKAREFCMAGVLFARENKKEPWAETLLRTLEEKMHGLS
jgi:tetratricopeptide (TPR) repeat protein